SMEAEIEDKLPSKSHVANDQQKLVFEQYKLAVEMAAGISARRQAANSFFIGLVSGFGILNSLLDKPKADLRALLILPICLCVVWWLTLYSYRRINKAKWEVIYELEEKLPKQPFTREDHLLNLQHGEQPKDSMRRQARSPAGSRSFSLTKL